jgi:hypothetical protein
MNCATCLELHGAGCEGTHEDDAGKWVCLFCLDGEICPIQAKRMRAAKKNTPPDETPPTNEGNSGKTANEPQDEGKTLLNAQSDTPKKICARPGCTVELSSENTCGRCRAHVRWQDRTSSAGNGHAAAGSNGSHAAANGSAKKTNDRNGHAAAPANGNGAAAVLPELAADRVDQLLATLTPATKRDLLLAYLRGTV